MSFIPFFLQTSSSTAASSSGMGGGLGMMIPLILIVVIMYFFMIRPQNKKQKETEKMIAALKKGDKVITIGGINGVVSSTKEKTVVVKVDDNTKIEFNRTAIATVVVDKPVEAAKEAAPAKKSFFGKKTKKDAIADEIKDKDSTSTENKEAETGAKKDE